MDKTKKMLGVVTMLYEDYFFLERWYEYYSKQVGAENLYVFSHGNDPKHREIAKNANVMNLPRDVSMFKFDRRRWRMMSHLASGLLDYYNWMIVTDVDEIVVVDPNAAPTLVDYILENYDAPGVNLKNISPLGLELIHLPEEEPLAIEKNETILSQRRIFRPNANYSKPCLVAAPAVFGPGGHRNNLGRRHLSDDLYLLHLKFFDLSTMESVAKIRGQLTAVAGDLGTDGFQAHPWSKTLDTYRKILSLMTLADEDIELPEIRASMRKQREKYHNQFVWGRIKNTKLHRIPERFAKVF